MFLASSFKHNFQNTKKKKLGRPFLYIYIYIYIFFSNFIESNVHITFFFFFLDNDKLQN